MSSGLHHLQPFTACDRGGVAALFGLSVVLLVGAAGLCIDGSRATSAKFALQQDVDATVLHVAAERLRSGQNFDSQAMSETYLNGLRRAKQATGPIKVSVNEVDETKISISAQTKVLTTAGKVLGFGPFAISATAEAEIGQEPIEVVLALDNTTSMEGAKLAALKDAAKMLIDAAFRAPEAVNSVKMGIVPFAEYVNVGIDKRGSAWLDVEDDDVSGSQKYCTWDTSAVLVANSCTTFSSTYTLDGVTYPSSGEACQFTGASGTTTCQSTISNVWRGCVGSRAYPLELSDSGYSQRIPGLMNSWCPQPITPLQSDADALKAAIDSMSASGNTYIPTGLIWGWRVLSDIQPFDEAHAYGANVNGKPVRKILVMMTDGENSNSPSYPWHGGSDVAEANTLTAESCAGIKAAGIEIYTVAFDVTDDAIKGVLEACASSTSNYFDAMGTTQLSSAFEAIAKEFSPLHLTR
ncbi:MAG: hypothetical protein ACKVP4_07980 [Hyphomicrobium sp.]